MHRSTFVLLGLAAFGMILGTFIVRGTTRLVIGDQLSMLLALPLAAVSLLLVLTLVSLAILDRLGIKRLDDDLPAE